MDPSKRLIRRKSRFLSENYLLITILASILVSLLLGITLRDTISADDERQLMYIGFIGEIFLRCLRCLSVLIITTSVIVSMSRFDLATGSRLILVTFSYYTLTLIVSLTVGIGVILTLEPGKRVKNWQSKSSYIDHSPSNLTSVDTLLDLMRNFFPTNIFEAAIRSTVTTVIKFNNTEHITIGQRESTNIIGIVFYGLIFGATIGHLGVKGEPVRKFFNTINESLLILVSQVIKLTPIALVSLITKQLLEVEDLVNLLYSIGYFLITVLLAVCIHCVIILPLIYFFLVSRNPFKLFVKLKNAIAIAFGTGSSSVTLPLTIECMKNDDCDEKIVEFVLPIGSVINVDGAALYLAMAPLFLAQVKGIELDLGVILLPCVVSTFASIGSSAIPQAGTVMIAIIFETLNIPITDAVIVYSLDWFLDRVTTVLSIIGDCFGTAIINRLAGKCFDVNRRQKSCDRDASGEGFLLAERPVIN